MAALYVVGALASAILAALAAAGVVHLTEAVPVEAEAPTSLYFPYIHDGAGTSYQETTTTWNAATGAITLDNPQPVVSQAYHALRVRAGVNITNEAGQTVPAVAIDQGINDADGLWMSSVITYFDATTRSLMRIDRHNLTANVLDGEAADTSFPVELPFIEDAYQASPVSIAVALQGQSVAFGTRLSAAEGLPVPVDPFASSANMVQGERTITVGYPERVDGRFLVPVYDSYTSHWATSTQRGIDQWNLTTWHDGMSVFPVKQRYERLFTRDGVPAISAPIHDLVEAAAIGVGLGNASIPWGPAFNPTSSSPPRLEIGKPLSSGLAWEGYRIEDAQAATASDPKLVRFLAWRTLNPGSLLIGARYDHKWSDASSANDAVERWSLVYGAPGSTNAITVQSVRSPGMPAVQSDAASLGTALPSPTKPLNPGDVPPETVTLGQAVVLWSAFDSNVTGLPTSVTWANGYYLDQVGAVNVDPTRVMRYLILTRDDTTPDGAPVTRSLDLDASSGRLEYGETYVQRTSADHWLASINGNHPGPGNLPKYTGPFSPEAAAEVAFSLTFLVYFLPWLRTAAVGLFSRIAGDRLLDHKLREQLVNQVRADPGISAPRLHKTSGAGWSTVVYHLKRLEASGLLASVRDGRHRRYFLANLPAAERTRLTVLRNATTQRVFDLIQQGAPSRVILAQTLGLARPTVTWHLRRLLEAGLVTRFGTGQNITYRPNDQAN